MNVRDFDIHTVFEEVANEVSDLARLAVGLSNGIKNVAPPNAPSNGIQYLDCSGEFNQQIHQQIIDTTPAKNVIIGRPGIK